MKLSVRIVHCSGDIEVRQLESFPALIGRGESCEFSIEDGKASRAHARLDLERDEEGDTVLVVEDLGSSNGTFINGERCESARFGPGDVLEIGSTELRILGGARREESVRRAASSRRVVSILGPALVFLALVGLAAWWFVWNRGQDPVTKPVPRELVEARAALAAARAELLQLENIDMSVVARLGRLVEQHGRVDFGDGTKPFEELRTRIRERHELDSSNRLAGLIRLRDEAVATGDFSFALRVVKEDGAALVRDDPRKEEAVRNLGSSLSRALRSGLEKIEGEARYLESMSLEEEARALLTDALEGFRGTPELSRVRELQKEQDARLAARREKREAEIASRRERVRAWRERAQEAGGGTGAGSGRASKPKTESEKVAALVVRRKDGALLAVVEKWSTEKLVREASGVLRGKELLYAARFAYRGGLDREADSMLVDYHRSAGSKSAGAAAGRGAELHADEIASRVLTDARGLSEVPEGGFVFSRKHGWESAPDRSRRVAVEDATSVTRKIRSARSVEMLTDRFAKLMAIVERPVLTGEARGEVRTLGIECLEELRASYEAKLLKRASHSAFRGLGQAREELDVLRAEALKVIFDTKVYLPENHPDWPRGDKVNGQLEVDAAVGKVRELWNNAGSYALKTDGKSKIYSELLRFIDEECFPRLRYRRRDEGHESLAQLRRNLNERVDLKTFARNRGEAELYRVNRKVEAYNAGLDDPDISESDKAHAKVVNDYREMMGLRRMFLDARLCRATRKHSAECDKSGRIWHNGPDGSPGSRARAEGFGGGVAENVAIGYGNPEDIWWRGWYRASDHHRNALGRSWNCIGYGYVGRVGTQNFAATTVPFQ